VARALIGIKSAETGVGNAVETETETETEHDDEAAVAVAAGAGTGRLMPADEVGVEIAVGTGVETVGAAEVEGGSHHLDIIWSFNTVGGFAQKADLTVIL